MLKRFIPYSVNVITKKLTNGKLHAFPVLGSFIFGIVGSGDADIVGNGVGAGVAGGKYL